jgi:hypothetical protein
MSQNNSSNIAYFIFSNAKFKISKILAFKALPFWQLFRAEKLPISKNMTLLFSY